MVGRTEEANPAKLSFGWAILAVLGAPIATYGWAHRLIPVLVVKWSVGRFANTDKHKAQIATTVIVAGLVVFGVWYAACVLLFHRFLGWHATVWYIASLPISGIIAHYYYRKMRQLSTGVWDTFTLLRAPGAAKRLLKLRSELIDEIESVQRELGNDVGSRT